MAKIYAVKLTLDTPILGSQPSRDVTEQYIHAKAIADGNLTPEKSTEELETLPELLDRGTTVFHRDDDGNPILLDYQIKGLLKDWALTLSGSSEVGGIKNFRSKVDNVVFVTPRFIHLQGGGEITFNERPLRALTPLGPRVALVRSEQLPADTFIEFRLSIVLAKEITEAHLRTILDMGQYKGLGQWRNGGWGRFHYEMVEVQ